jgi:enoyl-CoA hydratase
MTELVSYRLEDNVATVTMDDGKRNALSPDMLQQVSAALTRAAEESAVTVLAGREGVFSAGFDLSVLKARGPSALAMLRAGGNLSLQMLEHPVPLVLACTGHAVAMGVFLLLSGDYRIGAAGPYKITANEVAIGMAIPHAAVEVCRQRLTPADFNRALLLAEVYAPENARAAGFLDRVVQPSELLETAHKTAVELTKLDKRAHAASKQRVRAHALAAVRAGVALDDEAFKSFV